MLQRHNFKIRFNEEHRKNPELPWLALIDDVEHLVSDVEIDNQPVKTIEHKLPTGVSSNCKSAFFER